MMVLLGVAKLICKETSIEPRFEAKAIRRNSAEKIANNKDTRPKKRTVFSYNSTVATLPKHL
jgi:hypothetical protein